MLTNRSRLVADIKSRLYRSAVRFWRAVVAPLTAMKISPGQVVLGQINEPNGRAPVARAPLVVRGWALGITSPVTRVEVWLDGRSQGCAAIGRVRFDSAVAWRNGAAELSGFELRLDPQRLHPLGDRALLLARVILLDGTRADLPAVEIIVGPAVEPATSSPAGSLERILPGPPRTQSGLRRIRLLCFARSLDQGGSQLRLLELVQYLKLIGGFETTVVAPGEGPLRRALESADALVHLAPIRIDDTAAYEEQLTAMATWAADRFDLVLAGTLTSFPAIDLANRLGLPSVWRIGEAEPLPTVVDWLGESLDPAVELRAHRAFDTASVVLFNSEAALRRHRPAGVAERCVVLASGADVAGACAYVRATSRDACRQTLGIGPDRRVLICAGTLWPIKGQALLVSALKYVRADRPLECVMIGQRCEPYAGAVSRLIRHHRLAGSVRLIPFSDDLRPWWRAADVAVCPSESESMPASVLEAMAFGLPVLASRVGGIPEVVADGVNGWLCEPNDLGSLIAGLERVAAAEPEELRALGDRAARRVSDAQDRSEALARMTDLLRHVARGVRPHWLDQQTATRRDEWEGAGESKASATSLPP
jgi:D-inositol-3-phosphate glycosyltransferase